MKENKKLWTLFGVLANFFSWGLPLVFVGIVYGAFLFSNSIVIVFGVALIVVFAVIMRSLKGVAENGYAMNAKVARSFRITVPLMLLVGFVAAVNVGIASLVPLIMVFAIGNILAQPLYVLQYRVSKAYVRDTGVNELLDR